MHIYIYIFHLLPCSLSSLARLFFVLDCFFMGTWFMPLFGRSRGKTFDPHSASHQGEARVVWRNTKVLERVRERGAEGRGGGKLTRGFLRSSLIDYLANFTCFSYNLQKIYRLSRKSCSTDIIGIIFISAMKFARFRYPYLFLTQIVWSICVIILLYIYYTYTIIFLLRKTDCRFFQIYNLSATLKVIQC